MTLPFDEQGTAEQIQAEALSETLHAPVRPNVSVYNYTPQLSTGEAHPRNTETTREGDVTLKDATKGQVGAFSVLGIFTGEDERFAYVSEFMYCYHLTLRNGLCHAWWK